MNLTGFALRNQPLVLVVFVALVVYSLSVLDDFPSQEDPPITVREAVVTTFVPGMEPDDVELLVTRTIEQALAAVPERDYIYSWSRHGHSEVRIKVLDQYESEDLDIIWQDVRNKVIDATPQLPEDVIGPFVNDDFGDVTVVSAALTGEGFALADVHAVAKRIQDQLYLVDGVKRVTLYGVQNETVWIEFSSARLAQLGFSVSEIARTLVTQNVVLPGGSIDTGQREIVVTPRGDFETVEDIENVPIEIPGTGDVVTLGDLADVRRAYVDPPVRPFYYDGEQAILIGVSMADGRNVLDMGPRVVERLEELEQLLPMGFRIRIGNYQPTHVERAVAAVRSNLFQTIAIVLVVIVGFLGVRTGLIVGLHVPLTMIVTLLVMYLFGIAMHRISLATLIISLGLLVDNGIVVAEEIGKRLFQGEERIAAATNTGRTLAMPLLTSSITTVLMFMPLAMAPHSAGEYLRSMAQVILISLAVSWLLAMTVTPILCNRFLPVPEVSEEEVKAQYEKPIYRRYRSLLEGLLSQRTLFLGSMVGVLVVGFWLFGKVPEQFMPESDRPQIMVDVKLPSGYGIRESERRIHDLVDWLEDESQNPEITQTLTYVGNGGVRFFVTISPEAAAANMGFVLITVDSVDDVGPVMRRLRAHARQSYPAIDLLVKRMFLGSTETGLVEARLSTLGLPEQREALFAASERVADAFASVPRTINIYNDFENRVIQAVVDVDPVRARRAGVTNDEIASSLQAVLEGGTVTILRQGDEEIPITFRAVAEERLAVDRLMTANVFSRSTGTAVPLIQIANVYPENSFSVIMRRDYAPTVTVQATSLTLTARELENAVEAKIDAIMSELGPGFSWEWGGETEGQTDAQTALFAFVPLALFGVLICLVGQFNSVRKPVVILLTIPLAFTGVAIGLLVGNGFYSFMALLGILSLVGIVVNNAIVMLEQVEIEREAGRDPYDAIVTACQARLRPILMTTMTTILGMMPIIISQDPLFYDMAITIAFGLAFATVLTLGLAPVLYAVVLRIPSPSR
ncbi:MAG: efflux RND transporter permease subunit [Deltaproteobacteria bacterium]|jgi:multidrug efflux pump subunit AcrB|nr:efflux RND transporter permease subunit [Deltaproteobacteria bacterium]